MGGLLRATAARADQGRRYLLGAHHRRLADDLHDVYIAWIVGLVVSGGLYYAMVRAQRTRTAVPTTGVPRRAEA